jgi:hypothetical protein
MAVLAVAYKGRLTQDYRLEPRLAESPGGRLGFKRGVSNDFKKKIPLNARS